MNLKSFLLLGIAFTMIAFTACNNQSARKPLSGKELFSNFYKPYNPDEDVRGKKDRIAAENAEGSEEEVLQYRADGIQAYANKNYAQAITLFESYLKYKSNDMVVPFYLGGCYLSTDNISKASAQFENVVKNPDGVFFENAQWYLALIAVENENYTRAHELLESIMKQPNHYYHEQAETLIGQVEYIQQNGK